MTLEALQSHCNDCMHTPRLTACEVGIFFQVFFEE